MTTDEATPTLATFNFKQYQDAKARAESSAKLGDRTGTTPSATQTGGFNDTRNDIDADGKYLLLAVPEFHPGLSTYLRLGAACSTWETALGAELEKVVHLTGPDGKTTNLPFIDDERQRGGAKVNPGVGATISESEILHTKGGWRDHTDGNRITTTYGDKIEIIRGNYKMVVLGRQDTPADSAGWDLSGQIMQDWGYSKPGASVTLEWVPLYGGTWLRKESLDIFNQWNRTAGLKKDEYWGDLLESYVGQEVPGVSLPQDPAWTGGGLLNPSLKTNPVMIDKTFALSITSQTGSQVLPVPTITEDTYVTVSTSSTTADSITDETTVTGAITGSTTAGSITSTTDVSDAVSEATTVGGSVSTTTNVSGSVDGSTTVAGAITEVTTATTITETTTTGTATSITAATSIDAVTLADIRTSVFVGLLDASLYAAALKLELAAGFALEVNLVQKVNASFPLDLTISLLNVNLDLAKTVTTTESYTLVTGIFVAYCGVTRIVASVANFGLSV